MIVTGVQAAGATGLRSVQGAAIDSSEIGRAASTADPRSERDSRVKNGVPQPVVFPREGLPLDQRPVEHRLQRAAARYHSDGGQHDDADTA